MLALCLGAAFLVSATDGTLSTDLVRVWIGNSLPLTLLALGAAVVISCGRIDIASGAAMSTVGMIIVGTYGWASSHWVGAFAGHAFAA
jgi:ribose/xylose/arabinose/galactoside ABC-type transport system permease subunit